MIEELERAGLGLARNGTVVLVPHRAEWAAAFEREAARIGRYRLEHVGSTSIPGIHAKPVLDILLIADFVERSHLESLGYTWKGEYGIPGRSYCVLYDRAQERGFVHLHGFAPGHPEAEAHLLFRDYLRAHPERARAYEARKLELMRVPRDQYTEAKAPLIRELLGEARSWRG